MSGARILGVVWDGAGNFPPQALLYRRLVEAGHSVRVLAHRSQKEAVEACGATFRPYRRVIELESRRSPVPMAAEREFQFEHVLFAQGYAEDVRDELRRAPTDLALVDGILFTALAGVEAAGVPAVVVWHSVLGAMLEEPPERSLDVGLDALDACRHRLGLDPVDSVFAPCLRAAALLAATAPAFDVASSRLGEAVHFVGPLLDLPSPGERAAARDGAIDGDSDVARQVPPRVLVSFSSGDQEQAAALQRVLDALADRPLRIVVTLGHALDPAALRVPANATLRRFQPHRELLPATSLVVTHAGHGTVMSALAYGVPLLCLPMGRDQHLVARRVEALGVGLQLDVDAPPPVIVAAVDEILRDDAMRRRAEALGRSIDPAAGLDRALTVVETVVGRGEGSDLGASDAGASDAGASDAEA